MRVLKALCRTIRAFIVVMAVPYIFGALMSVFAPVLRDDPVLMWIAGFGGATIVVAMIVTFWVNYEAEEL